MANLITMRRWNGAKPTDSATQSVTLRDEDFGEPNRIKRVSRVNVTYKSATALTMNGLLSYVIDGGTTFGTSGVPSTALAASVTWDVGAIKFSSPIACQSIRVKLTPTEGTQSFEINDVGVEARLIHKRVS